MLAKAMHEQMFGIPTMVKSDGGPHFVGGWWQTMCALPGSEWLMDRRTGIRRWDEWGRLNRHILVKLRALVTDLNEPVVTLV